MPNLLNKNDLNYARTLLEERGPSAMYDYFSAQGYKYPTLANGVAKGDSLAGKAALSFMKETAQENNKKILESQVDHFKYEETSLAEDFFTKEQRHI